MNERKPFLNNLVSRLLLGWITAGVLFLIIGLVWVVVTDITTEDSLRGVGRMHQMGAVNRLTLAQILHGVGRLQPEALINLGILLILLTPIVRVVALSGFFLAARDRKYGLISLTTFLILLMDFIFALR
jgi:uncharacterized membrane protein